MKVWKKGQTNLQQICQIDGDTNHRKVIGINMSCKIDLPDASVYLSEGELLFYIFQMRRHCFYTLFIVSQLILKVHFFFLHLLQLFKSQDCQITICSWVIRTCSYLKICSPDYIFNILQITDQIKSNACPTYSPKKSNETSKEKVVTKTLEPLSTSLYRDNQTSHGITPLDHPSPKPK